MAEETVRIAPRLPKALVEELKADAELEGRTLEGAVMVAIREYLARRKQIKPQGESAAHGQS